MQRFRQETGKSHRAGPVLTSAENDLAALQENFSFGKSRYIRNDKAAKPMRSAQRSSTFNAISFQQKCTEPFARRQLQGAASRCLVSRPLDNPMNAPRGWRLLSMAQGKDMLRR
jgi:hypothetical protein